MQLTPLATTLIPVKKLRFRVNYILVRSIDNNNNNNNTKIHQNFTLYSYEDDKNSYHG